MSMLSYSGVIASPTLVISAAQALLLLALVSGLINAFCSHA